MKSKANKLIEKRDKLSTDITKYWNIINVENVVNKNYKRHYELKELYNSIVEMCKERAMTKLKALCINMGIRNFKDLPADNIQKDIFMLSELNEIKVRLSKVRTINPKLKISKGKKNLNKTEVLTSNWIKARIDELNLQIIEIKDKLNKFNESAELEEETPMELAA